MDGELLNGAPDTVEERTESILSKLGDDDAAPPAGDDESAPAQGADPAPAEPASGGDEGQPEPAQPAIEAPLSWSAEDKALFAKLPPEAQAIIAKRESERERGVNQRMNEAAEKAKAAEAERQQAAKERQRYVQQLSTFIEAAQTFDPILAEGQKTDWVKLAAENPAEAQVKWFQYQQRLGMVQQAMQQREVLAAQERQQIFAREEAALLEKIPEWRDPDKGRKAMQEIREGAVRRYGFKPEEVQTIPDHRYALILKDALAYHQLLAAQKAAETKKVAPVPRVQRPQAANGDGQRSERVVAKLKQAKWSDSVDDRVNAVLAALD